jgi:hypothetical protein
MLENQLRKLNEEIDVVSAEIRVEKAKWEKANAEDKPVFLKSVDDLKEALKDLIAHRRELSLASIAASIPNPASAAPSPVTSGWLFDYIGALQSSSVPAANNALTLPEGVKIMNVKDLGNSFFIRPCYPKLWGMISNTIEQTGKESYERDHTSRFIVMGIPGIGKTTFLYYLLHVLVKQKKCVVFEDFKGLMFMVQKNGEIFEGKRGDPVFKDPLADSSAFYLFNCGGSVGTTTPLLENVEAVTIAASSPSEDHTKELSKTLHSVNYMTMWNLDELQLCREKCTSPLSRAVVDDRFAQWGGVARQVLFKGDEEILSAQLETALSKFDLNPQDVLSCVGGADTRMMSHKLLHYNVDESSFKKYSVMLASDYIGDRMCEMNLKGVLKRIASLQTDTEENGLRGRLFEHFAHRVLPLGSRAFGNTAKLKLKMSPFPSGGDDVPIPEVASSQKTRSISDLPAFSPSGRCVYFKPTVPNYPIVDALVTPRTGYQITVSTSHGVKIDPFITLLDKLGCTEELKFRLVWVVPSDVNFKCKELPAIISDRVEQFILKLPFLVPPSLAFAKDFSVKPLANKNDNKL